MYVDESIISLYFIVMGKRNALKIEDRQTRIALLIKEKQKVTVSELCEKFNMSIVTIRNDLTLLEEKGAIIRTHGGAISVREQDELATLPFEVREEKNFAAKQAIGKAAAKLINNGEVIFIDGGTTASEMRLYMKDHKDVTVVTPSIAVTYWLAVTGTLDIYVLNGLFKRESYSTTGIPSMDFMSKWNLSKAFFGAAGFTLNEGLSDLHPDFVNQKKIIAEKAITKIGLIDSSKIDIIITDENAPPEDVKKAIEAGIDVMIVSI